MLCFMVVVEAISSQGCLWACAPPPPGLAPPRRPVYNPRGHLHLPGSRRSPPHHTLSWGPFPTYSVGAPSPPYDEVISILQPVDLEGLQKGGLSSFEGLPRPTLFSSLVGSPMGAEGQFTWPLHVVRRGLCPHEVCAVIQLLPLEDDFVAPPLRLDPLCIVVKVLEAVPMHLLVKIVQEG